jgi:hypothetical protein
MTSLPLRHVSIRVPWHDAGWDGTVCRNPKGNAACLVLKEIRDTRDDDREEDLAGRSVDELEQITQWPACMGERGSFMAPFEINRVIKHPYAATSEDHAHIKPVVFHQPPFSAATIPFRWMLRDEAWTLAQELDLDVDPGREPTEGFLEKNSWVQDHHNQRALLDAFFSAVQPAQSLCFFYSHLLRHVHRWIEAQRGPTRRIDSRARRSGQELGQSCQRTLPMTLSSSRSGANWRRWPSSQVNRIVRPPRYADDSAITDSSASWSGCRTQCLSSRWWSWNRSLIQIHWLWQSCFLSLLLSTPPLGPARPNQETPTGRRPNRLHCAP